MTVQEVVGWNARELRIKSGFTQDELGELLTPLLRAEDVDGATSGVVWRKSRVDKLEKGRLRYHNANDLLLSELLALSWLFRVSVVRLLTPPLGVETVATAGPGARPIDTPDTYFIQYFVNPRWRDSSPQPEHRDALYALPHPAQRSETRAGGVGFTKRTQHGAQYHLEDHQQTELEGAPWLRDMLEHWRRAGSADDRRDPNA